MQLECDQEAEAGVVSARRRNTMITVGGHAVNLLNLQLTLVDRNFSAGDYDVLLGLDDSAGGQPARAGAVVKADVCCQKCWPSSDLGLGGGDARGK